MNEIQNDTKSVTKLEDVPDPLTQYSDFRGLFLADYKVALATTFSQDKLNKLKNETLDAVDYDEQMNLVSRNGVMDRSLYARPEKAHV